MTRQTDKGSIILYALLTMASMLAIGLALSGLFISKLRLSASARDSVAAIALADSGVERCLFEARVGPLPEPMQLLEQARLEIVDLATGDALAAGCTALQGAPDTFSFQAIGTYRGVQRTLEISQ